MSDDLAREMTLKLVKPLQLGDIGVSELQLREPTVGELAKAADEASGYRGDIALISIIAKQPKAMIEQMGAEDFAKASTFLGNFTRRGMASGIGGSSSQS